MSLLDDRLVVQGAIRVFFWNTVCSYVLSGAMDDTDLSTSTRGGSYTTVVVIGDDA